MPNFRSHITRHFCKNVFRNVMALEESHSKSIVSPVTKSYINEHVTQSSCCTACTDIKANQDFECNVCGSTKVPVCDEADTITVAFDLKDNNDDSAHENEKSSPPDGGWGWVVAFSAFMINIVVIGSHNCFGLLYLDVMDEFKESLSKTAWIGSIAFGSILVFAPLSGALSNKFGCRKISVLGLVIASVCFFASSFVTSVDAMFVTYGFGFGFGTSLCYMQGAVMVSSYFSSRRALANGIALAGSAVGTIFIAPIYNAMNKYAGWRAAVRVLSGCVFLTLICAVSYRALEKPGLKPSSVEEKLKSSPARKFVLDLSLWKNKAFVVWSIAVGLCKVGYLVPWVHMPKLSTDINLSREFGSQLLQYMSVTAGASRLLAGKVADSPRINRLYISQFCTFMMGAVNLAQPSLQTKAGLLAYAVLLGLLDGGVEILLPVMTLDLVGAERLSVAWGCILAVISLSSMGPPIAGAIREYSGNYKLAFYLTGSAMILSSLVLTLIPMWAQKLPQAPATSFLSIDPSQLDIDGGNDKECAANRNTSHNPPFAVSIQRHIRVGKKSVSGRQLLNTSHQTEIL